MDAQKDRGIDSQTDLQIGGEDTDIEKNGEMNRAPV